MIKEPQQKISPEAVKMWRVVDLIVYFTIVLFLLAILFFQKFYGWNDLISKIIYLSMILVFISSVIEIIFIPVYRQRTWRYEVDSKYIQLKHGGAIKKNHYIIPMTKVQYVNSSQGPISRKFGLSTIRIGTMASEHKIPAIPERESIELRERIAFLAGIQESDKGRENESE
ncbi:PH domain-containing protein [Caldalkalibacillus mannanilyticus]|uniref:PH domain-containing protein n=1 Tax=Caldalkalibacillus mannanilyticus TaxID=1418 RepID=UPI000468B916|nr:PH domain-containing protein [Caldalkalibacillus mannanilyticus]